MTVGLGPCICRTLPGRVKVGAFGSLMDYDLGQTATAKPLYRGGISHLPHGPGTDMVRWKWRPASTLLPLEWATRRFVADIEKTNYTHLQSNGNGTAGTGLAEKLYHCMCLLNNL